VASGEGKAMNSIDLNGVRNILTAAATADVEEGRPAICGTVTLHCIDDGEPLRLVMSMLDAILLLNSLREIEANFNLEEWATRLGCSMNLADWIAEELRRQHSLDNDDDLVPPPGSLLIN
jgi:hypothetical protein